MSKQAFEHSMPTEFWSEVVTRVEQEAPDTLLLAEAFWLMEPYFVRTLGMHRVYNSAFMHLMRERENPRFQALLADTLEHDPELARRSLNFMTTPDEAPAAHGFGRDDRYFGTTALMATLPGPPLFGHGQFDGLTEQYGMDSLRQQLDETPDPAVAERHRREVAPLLRRAREIRRRLPARTARVRRPRRPRLAGRLRLRLGSELRASTGALQQLGGRRRGEGSGTRRLGPGRPAAGGGHRAPADRPAPRLRSRGSRDRSRGAGAAHRTRPVAGVSPRARGRQMTVPSGTVASRGMMTMPSRME